MTDPLPSERIQAELDEALNRRVPWWRRILDALRRLPARVGRMGGYWGGVTMWDRRKNKP